MILNFRNYLPQLKGADNSSQSLLCVYVPMSFAEIYLQSKDLDLTKIDLQVEAR